MLPSCCDSLVSKSCFHLASSFPMDSMERVVESEPRSYIRRIVFFCFIFGTYYQFMELSHRD
jgi:hypothetical protein